MKARFRGSLPAAAGGLVAGHFLTYVFLTPAGPHRAAFLRQTGHGYFARAVAVAAGLARGFVRRRAADAEGLSWRALAVRFAVIQAAGFVVLEIIERLVVHAPLGGLVSVLPVGLCVESAVAALVAAILVATARASESIASALVRRRPTRHAGRPAFPLNSCDHSVPALRFFGSSATFRGPPLPSVA
ncbi:MAG: hypothetical protein E6G68_06260 [Actinobacteria bacterium]|nr:MAG: hypothetical protein E6G68_06260 [Actinomycetota bacterium]